MHIPRLLIISIILFLSVGCKNKHATTDTSSHNSYSGSEESEEGNNTGEYEDGTYCASVNYYNPNTGTVGTYTLNVEVESNELVRIYWGNGGWLDEDHFSAQELDDDGYCSFTSDKGNTYRVTINEEGGCSHTDEYRMRNDVEEDKAAVTCPKCGDDKYETDDYCSSCERKIEDERDNTCSRCGRYEYGVYGGLCSSCKDDDEDDNQ
jgi:ribosomal protein L37E